jgi:hypothetical protein
MTRPTPTSPRLANDPTPWAAAGEPAPTVLQGRAARLVPLRVVAAARHPAGLVSARIAFLLLRRRGFFA